MTTNIFVNLPVKDLDRSMSFFRRLGFTFNTQFTDETAACMVIADNIYAMLLTHPKFLQFTSKDIADATRVTEVLVALSRESKADVDRFADAAIAGGGSEVRPAQDYGFMYGRSINDLDGHIWEVLWMDPTHVQKS